MFLDQQDSDLFFRLYFDLLGYANQKHKIVKNLTNARHPKIVYKQDAYVIREKLFTNPAWIDEYIQTYGKEFDEDELSILTSWRDHFIKDMFFVMKNLAKYSVFMNSGEASDPRLYGVTGLTQPISDFFNKSDLPVIVDAVILPFKGKIIYDGVFIPKKVHIGPYMSGSLNAQYKQIKEQYGIAERLPFTDVPKQKAQTATPQKKPAPNPLQELYDTIAPIIIEFCREHLNDEYSDVSLRMLGKLSRKRPSPLLKGKPNTWACGIVYAVGSNNFLFDKSQKPHMRAAELAAKFGLSQSTAGNKAGEINKILKISMFDPEWTLPGKLGDNPLVWMFQNEQGFVFDVRHAPREIQVRLFNAGQIPFIPADREIIKPSADDSQETTAPHKTNPPDKNKERVQIKGQISFDDDM